MGDQTFTKSADEKLIVTETETITHTRQYTKQEIDDIIALKQQELAYWQNIKAKTSDLATK